MAERLRHTPPCYNEIYKPPNSAVAAQHACTGEAARTWQVAQGELLRRSHVQKQGAEICIPCQTLCQVISGHAIARCQKRQGWGRVSCSMPREAFVVEAKQCAGSDGRCVSTCCTGWRPADDRTCRCLPLQYHMRTHPNLHCHISSPFLRNVASLGRSNFLVSYRAIRPKTP